MKVMWPGQYVMGSVAWVNNKHTRTTVSFVFVFFFLLHVQKRWVGL
jgi:hypothetical protein